MWINLFKQSIQNPTNFKTKRYNKMKIYSIETITLFNDNKFIGHIKRTKFGRNTKSSKTGKIQKFINILFNGAYKILSQKKIGEVKSNIL